MIFALIRSWQTKDQIKFDTVSAGVDANMLAVCNNDKVFLDLRAISQLNYSRFRVNVHHLAAQSDDGARCFGHLSQISMHVDPVVEVPSISELLSHVGKVDCRGHWFECVSFWSTGLARYQLVYRAKIRSVIRKGLQ